MTPTLRPETYVFWTLPPGETLRAGIVPFATVREDEGLTCVVEHEVTIESEGADTYRAITLRVHSSLKAVGFIAVVTRELARAGIAANVNSGYHHDHLLVPAEYAESAITILNESRTFAR